jgi:gas vesicle protein
MQRHHIQMLVVFVVSLTGVVTAGPLLGMVIGVLAALLMAPWSNPNLVRWLRHQCFGLLIEEGADPKFDAEKAQAAWQPMTQTLRYAMEVEDRNVAVKIGQRDLSDEDIRQLIELQKTAERAGVHFELQEEAKRPEEAMIDTALRRRAAKKIVLQKQV